MTSVDAFAERRFDFAQMMRARGDSAAAIDLYREALEIAPDWAEAHFALADALDDTGDTEAARNHYVEYLRLADIDIMGAEIRLALLGAAPMPERLPDAYVKTLFDQYAGRFDDSLLNKLGYSAPLQLQGLVERLRPVDWQAARALDLGCGTGLAGEAFRLHCAHLSGIDLSPKMLKQAARKNVYDDLRECDALSALTADAGPFELIVAADVLGYVGALEDLFAAVARTLAAKGLFVFSVEMSPAEDVILREQHRYAHSAAYIRRLAAANGLEVRILEQTSCRREKGIAVPHLVCALEATTPVHTPAEFENGCENVTVTPSNLE